jgi:hypothetical protein
MTRRDKAWWWVFVAFWLALGTLWAMLLKGYMIL